MVSRRRSASRGVLACTVVMEPSCPVFMAVSMSMTSAPRTSPTMTRSGLILKQFLTKSRWLTSPLPSMLAGSSSSRHTCSCCNCSSAESSMVMIRSVAGM